MPFSLVKIKSDEMLETLESWKSLFSRKRKGSAITQNAASIASQMIGTIETERRHGHLWVAKHDTSEKACALLIADDSKAGLTIRFLLSNVCDLEAKGSGKFLVEQLTAFADKKNLFIQTTSQNANAFWKKCPGFKQDEANSIEFTYTPKKQTLQYNRTPQKFFKNEHESKKGQIKPSYQKSAPTLEY